MESTDLITRSPKSPGLLVVFAGLVSTGFSLAIVFFIALLFDGFQIMGFYVNYILPVGAIGMGVLAGSGYGWASWLTGVKISRGMLWGVVGLLALSYIVFQYAEYRILDAAQPAGLPHTFWTYFDETTQTMAWSKDGQPGEKFGKWGYAIRSLEVIGFALGGLIVPAVFLNQPYCEDCQVYMKTRHLPPLPAGVPSRKIKKNDTDAQDAYTQEIADALQEGQSLLEKLLQAIGDEDVVVVGEVLAKNRDEEKATRASTGHVGLALVYCRYCLNGALGFAIVQGQGTEAQVLAASNVRVGSAFLRELQQVYPLGIR